MFGFARINEEAARNYESSKRSSVDIMAKVYLIGVVGEAICIFFAIYLTRRFTGAVRQIRTGIEQISNVVQTNSATAEQSAADSEVLTAQADAMKTLVSRFDLRKVEN